MLCTSLALLVTCALSSSQLTLVRPAFADGLFQENLPPASIGDRQLRLFIKINPPILTSDTKQDAYLQLRLFDARNNDTVKFTTYSISVTKGTNPKAEPLLTDAFLAENGLLTLKIQPQEGPVTVFSNLDPNLNAYQADHPGGDIKLTGPILLEGGLYHFKITLVTIDNIHTLFSPYSAPSYETYLSVGDVFKQDVQTADKTRTATYPVTIISYYDKVKDFGFNAGAKTFTWAMPFDWNTSRIEKAANVFVHEEIRVPKSFAGIGDANAFDAKVNGKPIAGRMLAVDPFSDEKNLIVHFLINKNDVLDMARNNNIHPPSTNDSQQQGMMTFSLSPASNASGAEQTSGEISTDTGGIHVLLSWTPSQLKAGTDTKLHLQFFDAFSGANISDDVKYDLKVFDKNGKAVFSSADQTAKGGAADQTLNFPADANYRVEVTVKALVKEGQSPDLTRNGVARGVVLVPEFPASLGVFLSVGAAIGIIVFMQRVGKQFGRRK